MGDSQYSFSLTTFSPTGKLVQIEHALTAVGSGQTSLGIKAANGVVIATEKKLPSILVDESSVQKIQNLTPNIGVVYRFVSACLLVTRKVHFFSAVVLVL
ncbi:proteasome subunit alpha type-2-like isoform X1 [Populus alba x Populus x berolinensis]|nr:proteasome subunit alpha type-2-like isoform X1 [Populus alba x Populus x berolinensis]